MTLGIQNNYCATFFNLQAHLSKIPSSITWQQVVGIAIAIFTTIAAPYTIYKAYKNIILQQAQHQQILTNSAHGKGPKISIPIGDVSNIQEFNDNTFAKVCRVINQVTLTPLYPATFISRNNHNGTHSARQARMVEVIFDLFMKGPQQTILQQFSLEQKMHLKLAAYLLRSGRIDESNHRNGSDDYCTRSSMIYKAYADQLKTSSEISDMMQNQLVNSCKPSGVRDENIDKNSIDLLCWTLLTVAHELDLIRCYSKDAIDSDIKQKIKSHLLPYVQDHSTVADLLLQFSKDLCEATGCYRHYDQHPGNKTTFKELSNEGDKCWETVSKVPFSETIREGHLIS